MGKVYLVGAGPGDAGLITVKGLEKIRQCDAIVYDRLANEELLERVRYLVRRSMWESRQVVITVSSKRLTRY